MTFLDQGLTFKNFKKLGYNINQQHQFTHINNYYFFFKCKFLGLGGVFIMKAGKAKQHVMRDFSSTPINTDEEVNNWLKFYDMSAPLIAVGTLVSTDPVNRQLVI